MQLSRLLGEHYKEKPNEAFLDSHIFMLRGGYIRQVANGIFSLLTPAKRIVHKIEDIIRDEMDAIDGQEVLFPVVLPAELWSESGRFESVGSELLRFKDRAGKDMLLGMTHEEAAVHLARGEAKSYTKYPFMIYQIQTKFRDEPRARGGLVRVREFTMKDAYSFHINQQDLEAYYDRVYEAYEKIFKRLGLTEFISVKSDSGMMGGKIAHEFMYLSDGGEDTLVICDACGYRSNMEVAVSETEKTGLETAESSEVLTLGIKTIETLAEFLKLRPEETLKATVFIRKDTGKPLVAFIRGDLEVNEAKLKNIIGSEVYPLTDEQIPGLCLGFIGPKGLSGTEIYYDKSLEGENNLVTGANKTDYHLKGFSMARDVGDVEYADFAKVKCGDACVHCGKPLKISRGIEIGNIFQLGDKYTKSMNMTYVDSDGSLKTPIMGCYGIGVGRVFACILENHHDEYGPIWPRSVAPWDIHICMLNANEEIIGEGFKIYNKLSEKYETVIDDRNLNAGIQFADADLLGIPIRVILSKRNMENREVEIVTRDKKFKKMVNVDEVYKEVERIINSLSS
ncbi:MAG: proline--tRNA ligase [Eubacterium sp.]|jgi:prolyl-tRNA synthetase|nr:proline--tRNA ligase [Eubacterium sp.]